MNRTDLIQKLRNVGVDLPELEARILCEEIAGLTRADMLGGAPVTFTPDQTQRINSTIERRAAGESLWRILGYRDFWKHRFALSPDTLEPRPDTETLIETVLKAPPPRRILDLGTGTGCILISLLHEFPEATGVGVDIAQGAVETAQLNAQNCGVGHRATFVRSNWFEHVEGKFDLIVSNPPYIPAPEIRNLQKEVQNHDPIRALDGGIDGLEPYKFLLPRCKNYLEAGGRVVMEIGIGQSEDLARLADDAGATLVRIVPDLGGVPRAVEIAYGDK